MLDMHSAVHHFNKRQYHAEITISIPVKDGVDYFSFGATRNTESAAVRRVIEMMENSAWFQHFRSRDVRFKVTGILERLYRGYL